MSMLRECVAIEFDFALQLLDALAKQVCQHAAAELAGEHKRLGVTGASDPERQSRLNRLRKRPEFDLLSQAISRQYRFAAPKLANGLDAADHRGFSVRIIFRRQCKVVRVPPGRK